MRKLDSTRGITEGEDDANGELEVQEGEMRDGHEHLPATGFKPV